MPILNIAPVTLEGTRLMVSLFGLSETGKTLTGLLLAAGIEPDPSKRLLLDTEGGQRGRLYKDDVPGGYLYAQLKPPFDPESYIQAIDEIEQAGVTVVVIDSISHSWNAAGGILDIVEQATEKNDRAKWNKPKRRLGKMIGRILSSDVHVILCSRAKQLLIEGKSPSGKTIFVPGPIVPIQEKSIRFDMTVMAQMQGRGRFSIKQEDGGKCPGRMLPIFDTELMGIEVGQRLIKFIGEQKVKTPAVRGLERACTEAAETGVAGLTAFLNRCTEEEKIHLKAERSNYIRIAKEADHRAEEARISALNDTAGDDDDDPFPMSPPSSPIVILPAGFWDRDDYALEAAQFESACRDCPGLDALLKLDEDNAGLLKAQPDLRKHLADRQRDLPREAA